MNPTQRGTSQRPERNLCFAVATVSILLAASTARPAQADQATLAPDPSYGHAALLAAGTASLWTAGRLSNQSNVTGAATDVAKGLLLNSALVYGIQSGVDHLGSDAEHQSFASAPTASAFTIAPILASRFGWKVGVPAFALAAAAGLGSLDTNQGFPTDVVAGATLGLVVGGAVAHQSRMHMPQMPEHLYMGRKGLGYKMKF